MLLTVELPGGRSESAQTIISNVLRLVLYLYNAICSIFMTKVLEMDSSKDNICT